MCGVGAVVGLTNSPNIGVGGWWQPIAPRKHRSSTCMQVANNEKRTRSSWTLKTGLHKPDPLNLYNIVLGLECREIV